MLKKKRTKKKKGAEEGLAFFPLLLCIAQVCSNHDDDDDVDDGDGAIADADADDHVAHADEEPPDDKFAHSCDGQWPHLKCN